MISFLISLVFMVVVFAVGVIFDRVDFSNIPKVFKLFFGVYVMHAAIFAAVVSFWTYRDYRKSNNSNGK